MHINEGHRYTIGLDHVQQKHHAVANFELSDLVIFQHVLELVGWQRPDAIRIFQRVLCDYFCVQFVEFNKIRVSEAEIFEQLGAFVGFIAQQRVLGDFLPGCLLQTRHFFYGNQLRLPAKCIFDCADWDRAALKRVAIILCCHTHDYNAVVQTIVENRTDLFFTAFIEKHYLLCLYDIRERLLLSKDKHNFEHKSHWQRHRKGQKDWIITSLISSSHESEIHSPSVLFFAQWLLLACWKK